MGNYTSCTLSNIKNSNKAAAKVVLPNGKIQQYDEPINAAELMFETPNYFLVNTKSLHMGRRFFALNADEDLEMGNVYIMFPMRRLNSIVTAADMAALFVTTNSAMKQRSSFNGITRVTPELITNGAYSYEEKDSSPRLMSFQDIEDISIPEIQHRLSMCRSRKPLLETIVEEPICLRWDGMIKS